MPFRRVVPPSPSRFPYNLAAKIRQKLKFVAASWVATPTWLFQRLLATRVFVQSLRENSAPIKSQFPCIRSKNLFQLNKTNTTALTHKQLKKQFFKRT
jgi:hypothetical protein